MRGVILDLATLDRNDLDLTELTALQPDWTYHEQTGPDELDSRLDQADIVLTNKVVLDRATLQRHPRIKLICVLATGTNNIDLAAAELGMTVCNVQAYGTASVTQHVYGLILGLARRLYQYQKAVQEGRWSRSDQFCLLDHPIEDISGRTLGIIGYGELGHAVARTAPAFDLQVMVAERADAPIREGRHALETVLSQADILTLHCPLTAATENMINAETLAAMKPDAWLINTARGPLVNEAALAHALDHGVIAAAALDVLSTEPPDPENPLLCKQRDNLIITPHIAWAARTARQKIIDLTVANIRAFLEHNTP